MRKPLFYLFFLSLSGSFSFRVFGKKLTLVVWNEKRERERKRREKGNNASSHEQAQNIVIKMKVELLGREHFYKKKNPMFHSAHDNKFIWMFSPFFCFFGSFFLATTETVCDAICGMLYLLVSCNKFHLIFAHKTWKQYSEWKRKMRTMLCMLCIF